MADAPEYRVKIVEDPPATGLAGWVEWLAKKRDALLVTGGLLYALGYAVWSYFAWRNGLGLLPAIDSQYFIAGIIPMLILLLVALGTRYCWQHAGKTQPPFWLSGRRLTGWRFWVRAGLQVLFALLVWSLIISDWTGHLGNYPRLDFLLKNILNVIIISSLLVNIFFAEPSAKQGDETWGQWLKRTFGRPLLILVLFVLGVIALFYYIDLLYSRLPQSLGGVKPRGAQLDLDREALSSEVLKALVPEDRLKPAAPPQDGAQPRPAPTPEPAPKVVPSKTVEILFSGNDVIVVRADGHVYEIQREVVKAIAWRE